MSVLNGIVEANCSETFSSYAEASEFIDIIIAKFGVDSFEGIQVRPEGYVVNYFA